MKLSPSLVTAVILFAGAGTLPAREQPAAMDRAKHIMAVRAAAKRVIEDSGALLDAPQTRTAMQSKIADALLADIPAHADRDASRKLCLAFTRASIQAVLVSNVVMAVADAAQHSPLPITTAEVLANVDADWTGSAERISGNFTERYFDGVYKAARETAIAAQRAQAEKKIGFPPFPALDAELSRLAGRQAQLSRAEFDAAAKWWAGEEFKKIQPLFKEVRTALDAAFKNIGNEVAVQFESQRALAGQSLSNRSDLAHYLTRDAIHGRVVSICRAEIQKNAPAAMPGGAGLTAPAYDLFGLTDAAIRLAAGQLETELFSGYIRKIASLPLASRDLEKKILADPAAHKTARQSERLLAEAVQREMSGWAASNYVRRPEVNALARNDATIAYFATQLAATGAAASAWAGCVQQSLAAPLETARAEIARRQMEKYFARLNSAEILPENAVDSLADTRNFAKFKTVAELSAALPDLAPAEKDTALLLEETEALALVRANALNSAAEQVLRGQEKCLQELEKEKIAQLEKQVDDRRPVDRIIAEWSDELAARWSIRARTAGSPYRALLGRTSELLNKTVRQLYDARRAAAEPRSAPQDSATPAAAIVPEDRVKTPSGAGGAAKAEARPARKTQGETSADLFLIIRDVENNTCEARLETADGVVLAKTSFDPAMVENAAEKVFATLRGNIHATLASNLTVSRGALFGLLPARRAGLQELGVYIVAPSVRVRLKTCLLLRAQIESLIDQWAQASSSSAPRLRWGTGFDGAGQMQSDQ